MYDPENGVGALHISAYEIPAPVDPKEELLKHLSDHKPPPDPEEVLEALDGTKRTASFEYVSNHSFQKIWFISHKNHLALATYECDAEEKKIRN